MPFFVYSPRRECPWRGKGTKRVQRIQELVVPEINTALRKHLCWWSQQNVWLNLIDCYSFVHSYANMIIPWEILRYRNALKLFTSFKGLSNIYCVTDLSRVWVMRIDSHLSWSALNRNCHLRAHSIRLERSICKSRGVDYLTIDLCIVSIKFHSWRNAIDLFTDTPAILN